uniref:Chloroplast small heat shock protein class I n=2 Tax=Solanum tuberosum TaxID=4113 RepID=M1AU50_SOLTU
MPHHLLVKSLLLQMQKSIGKRPLKLTIFKVDVPGIKKEEVEVEVEEGRILQISGERSREQEEKNDQWHRMERSSGKFLRRFRLPENAKTGEIKAAMENGVLTVTVPKEEEKKKSEVKAIDISG